MPALLPLPLNDALPFDQDGVTLDFYRVGPEWSRGSLVFCRDQYAAGEIGPAQDVPVSDIELRVVQRAGEDCPGKMAF